MKVPPCTAALRGRPIVSEASLTVQIDWSCQEDNLFGGVTAGSDPREISDGNGLQSNTPFSSKHPVDDFFIEAADAMKESDHLDGADDEKRMLQKSTRVKKRRRSSSSIDSIMSRVSSVSSLDSFSFVSPHVFDDRRSSAIDPRLLLFETDHSSLRQPVADLAFLSIDEKALLTAPLPDEHPSDSLLCMLGMAPGQSIVTEEEIQAEQASMTGEEKG